MSKPAAIDRDAQFRAKLDRCGYLIQKKQAADSEPWRAELQQLQAEIQEHFADSRADLPVRAAGNTYYIDLSKRENQRTITDQQKAFDALKKAMSLPALVKAIKLPFKLLDQWIPQEQQAAWVKQERTGSRDVSAVLIEAGQVA